MSYNQVYGNFTTGSGSWLKNNEFKKAKLNPYSDEIIDSYITQIQLDLLKIERITKIQSSLV